MAICVQIGALHLELKTLRVHMSAPFESKHSSSSSSSGKAAAEDVITISPALRLPFGVVHRLGGVDYQLLRVHAIDEQSERCYRWTVQLNIGTYSFPTG